MKVVFRVDASLQIGTGHVMRCLTLARALRERGDECYFVCREHKGNLIDFIQSQGFTVFGLKLLENNETDGLTSHALWLGVTQHQDMEAVKPIVLSLRPSWLIVDHYALSADWEQRFKKLGIKLLAIDDLADRLHDVDVLIDQNWYGKDTNKRYQLLVNDETLCLLGPKYALLSKEYAAYRKNLKVRSGQVHEILLFMGGADPDNWTLYVLEALSGINVRFNVVVGVNYPFWDELCEKTYSDDRVTLFRGVPTLADLMSAADLMIGAGGSTTWERMCLGLPAILLSVAHNQERICQDLSDEGLIVYLGKSTEVSPKTIRIAVQNILSTPDALLAKIPKMMEMSDGEGVKRILKILEE